MVAIEENNHFIIYQLGYTTGILPVNAYADIGLLVFVKIVVHNDVCASLQTIFYKFFDTGELSLCNLGYILSQCKAILAEVGIKVFGLIIFPFKFLVLNPVF